MKQKDFLESKNYNFNKQNLSDLLESLSVMEDTLLKSIDAKEKDLVEAFDYIYKEGRSIEDVSNDINFIKALSSESLRKDPIQNTNDLETFVTRPMKFMPIFNMEDNNLMNPKFLLIQTWNSENDMWGKVRLYEVNDDIKKFYDKLSSKTLEIIDGDDIYIYKTSTSGGEWVLENELPKKSNFNKVYRDEEFRNLINENDFKIRIV